MDLKQELQSQYYASLKMLQQTIEKCPPGLWNDPSDAPKYWQIAYHTLFYAHLYLAEKAESFTPWKKHRDESQFLGPLPWPPHREPRIGEPYSQAEVLEYLDFCQKEVAASLPALDLEAGSGFDWLPISKSELQIYNIRHIMQHTGELSTILRLRGNILIDWVGKK